MLFVVIEAIPITKVAKPAGYGAPPTRTHIHFSAGEFMFAGISTLVE